MTAPTPQQGTQRLHDWLLIALFLAFLAAPPLLHLSGHTSTELLTRTEARRPAPLPARPHGIKAWQQLPEKADAYVNDHFGLRGWLAGINSRLLVLLGSTSSQQVLVGKDHWLFLHRRGRVTEESRGAVAISEQEISRWISAVMVRRLQLRPAHLLLVLIPNKQSVYPELLPDWARPVRPNRYDRLVERLQTVSAIDLLDLKPLLLRSKGTAPRPLYYRTDTHWNHYGSFLGYQAIMERIRQYYPGLAMMERDDLEIVESPRDDFDLKRQHSYHFGYTETTTWVRLRHATHVTSSEVMTGKQRGRPEPDSADRFWGRHLRTDLVQAPRVLILGDSFTRTLSPFFDQSFHEVLYLDHARLGRYDRLITDYQPDLVLLIMLERTLPRVLPVARARRPPSRQATSKPAAPAKRRQKRPGSSG